ncbi:ERF family protein [Pseudonocardia acaciae]|uniref:ERF family protein n=1 Tax=Pseudonocardia acaciae TaxID=551276 RepID=UPI00048FC06F|nr:ERF family protein [Pseudonocardia acaciae]
MTTTPAPDSLGADSLGAALAAFQAELPWVGKDNTAQVRSEKGSYSYRYADLSEISPVVLPLLAKHGLSWSARPMLDDSDRFVLRYQLRHASGEKEQGDYPLPDPRSSPQVLGSAITYARRYSLCAVTGVAPGGDDDDAAAASHPSAQRDRAPAGQHARQDSERRPSEQKPEHKSEQKPRQPTPSAEAARALLRQTCAEQKWPLDRIAELYAETHDGANLKEASMRDVEEFRKSLFSRPEYQLRGLDEEQEAGP